MRKAVALTVLVLMLMLGGCDSGSEPASTSEAASTSTTTAQTAATTVETQPDRISGDFVIANTTAGGDEVGVESMGVIVEVAKDEGAWLELAAECRTTPEAPMVVSERQPVSFECELLDPLPADGAIRAVILADLFGTDDVFRQEVAIEP